MGSCAISDLDMLTWLGVVDSNASGLQVERSICSMRIGEHYNSKSAQSKQ
jgi:hypothetical protein